MANGLPVVAVNRVGYEPDPSGMTNGIQFWGSSFVAGPQGELLYRASDREEESVIVAIDMSIASRCVAGGRSFAIGESMNLATSPSASVTDD